MDVTKWTELMDKKENLCSELQRHVQYHPSLGKMIKHPPYFSVPHTDGLNAMANHMFKQKKKIAQEHKEKREWFAYTFMHERAYRLNAARLAKRLDNDFYDTGFWELISWVWTDSENIWEMMPQWIPILREFDNYQETVEKQFMDETELEFFKELPNDITVYRGCNQHNLKGLSWTLEYEVAEKFARRTRGHATVVSMTVPKTFFLAWLNGRQESELILSPTAMRKVNWKHLMRGLLP